MVQVTQTSPPGTPGNHGVSSYPLVKADLAGQRLGPQDGLPTPLSFGLFRRNCFNIIYKSGASEARGKMNLFMTREEWKPEDGIFNINTNTSAWNLVFLVTGGCSCQAPLRDAFHKLGCELIKFAQLIRTGCLGDSERTDPETGPREL